LAVRLHADALVNFEPTFGGLDSDDLLVEDA
jgi:hypothetical protein